MQEYAENEIIEGCKSNNRIFQEHLYKLKYSLFLKVCARYAHDMEDAEQLLQDGFLKIFKHIHDYEFKGSFEGWMRRIMVNNCLDYLKSKYTKENKRTDYGEELTDKYQYAHQNDGLDNLRLKDLIKLIQTLPPMSKTVFNLFVFDGYNHREISKMLEMSEGTSQWHVNNARKKLQEKILKSENLDYSKLNEQKKVKL